MNLDDQLLHRFYAGDKIALEDLADRYEPILGRITHQILLARTGSEVQAAEEWDVEERVDAVWSLVFMSSKVNAGRWPHQRISALTWIVHLLCQEIDRRLFGLRPPF